MEAADGSGRKRPRSAVDVSEDDGAGANAGEEAQVDVVAEDAAAKRQRTEVLPLAQDSLAGCANAIFVSNRPASHLLRPTPRFVSMAHHALLMRLLKLLLRRLPLRLPLPLGR